MQRPFPEQQPRCQAVTTGVLLSSLVYTHSCVKHPNLFQPHEVPLLGLNLQNRRLVTVDCASNTRSVLLPWQTLALDARGYVLRLGLLKAQHHQGERKL